MKITLNDILGVLPMLDRDKVNWLGEYGCAYTNDVGEHCLVGEIITAFNLAVPEFGEIGNQESIAILYENSADKYGWDFSDDAVEFLQILQSYADDFNKWGECINTAITALQNDYEIEIGEENNA